MSRTLIFGALLAVFVLFTAGSLFAGDAALVTEVRGTVEAGLADEKWNVELAEMLPDGVEIKVSADGALVLVHLATNREYRFEPDAVAVITAADITGEKFASSSIELVSSKISLTSEMGNQTGAVNPERVGASPLRAARKPLEETPAGDSETPAAPVPAPPAQAVAPAPAASPAPAPSMDEAGAQSADGMAAEPEVANKSIGALMDSEEMAKENFAAASALERLKKEASQGASASEAGSSAGENREEPEEDVAGPQPGSVVLAMPAEIFAKICSDESTLKVAGEKLADKVINFPLDQWVAVELIYGTEGYDKSVELSGNVGSMSIEICAPVKATIVEAWKLEKAGMMYQAAAAWLELHRSGLPAEKIAPHLERIKAKMLEMK